MNFKLLRQELNFLQLSCHFVLEILRSFKHLMLIVGMLGVILNAFKFPTISNNIIILNIIILKSNTTILILYYKYNSFYNIVMMQ